MSNGYLLLNDRRVRAIANVDNGVVLDVGAIADADVKNVAANRAIAPDRRLLAEMHVANYLSARVHVSFWVNLWMNPTKRSNHGFADSNIRNAKALSLVLCA